MTYLPEYPSTRPEKRMPLAELPDDELALLLGLTPDAYAGLPDEMRTAVRELLAA